MSGSDDQNKSILNSIKKSLNISKDYNAFDQDIILLINSAFAILHQLGVGPDEGFSIEDSTPTWDDYGLELPLEDVKMFVYMQVRMIFDPPTASVLTSFEKQLDELKWRIVVAVEDLS